MLTKNTEITKFEVNQINKVVSIRITTTIKENGQELSQSSHICSFIPGALEEVKACLGAEDSAEIQYLNNIWTDEAIANYEAIVQAQLAAQ